MDIVMDIADKYNLFVIEDCAQSHLTEYKGKLVGTFGIASSFSFYPGKNLGAYGDAGAILTENDDFATKFRMYARHGAIIKHDHIIEGINSRMDGLQAAFLNVKLAHIKTWTNNRIKIANLYDELLSDLSFINLPKRRKNCKHTFHLYVIRAQFRDELQRYLKNKSIEAAIHYPIALPFLKAYSRFDYHEFDYPIAFEYQKNILSLPMYPELSPEQVVYVCDTIKEFYS
jgi:dTDP-4-amino-4,6-dideoxygalactose transaminase